MTRIAVGRRGSFLSSSQPRCNKPFPWVRALFFLWRSVAMTDPTTKTTVIDQGREEGVDGREWSKGKTQEETECRSLRCSREMKGERGTLFFCKMKESPLHLPRTPNHLAPVTLSLSLAVRFGTRTNENTCLRMQLSRSKWYFTRLRNLIVQRSWVHVLGLFKMKYGVRAPPPPPPPPPTHTVAPLLTCPGQRKVT
jgi:hypothetical protein